MRRPKTIVPSVLAAICLTTLAAEIGWLRQAQAQAKRSVAAWERARQERDRLVRTTPAPTEENERAIAAALDEATRTLATLQERFGNSPASGTMPGGSVAAFFVLNRFVEEMRERAAATRVAVKPVERFGFASYATQGPPAALLEAVHRQRVGVDPILAALFSARPLALLEVKRDRPGGSEDGRNSPGADDFFTLPPTLSSRQAGLVEADAFRLEFTGQTGVLREFLNRLAGLPQPILVRAVEVEPIRPPPTATSRSSPEVEAWQRPQVSKFAVTLEIPRLVAPGS